MIQHVGRPRPYSKRAGEIYMQAMSHLEAKVVVVKVPVVADLVIQQVAVLRQTDMAAAGWALSPH